VFIVVFAGCAKQEDVLPPSVNYTSPLENAFFNVPSSIHVMADISAESIIETVSVRIVDANFVPQTAQSTLNPNSSVFELNEFISVEDIYLESGSYFIEVVATSQGETKRKYRSININEFPREYEGLFIPHSSGDVTIIQGTLDSLEIELHSGSFGSQETDLAIVNNFFGQNIIAKSSGDIFAYDKITNELLWEYNDSDPVNLTFYNDAQVYEDDRTVYFSNNKGQILGFNEFGDVINLIEVDNSGLGVGQFVIDNNKLICEVGVSEIESKLKVYAVSTGEILHQTPILMGVNNIVKIEEGQYLIAGEAIGGSEFQMQIYYSESNAFFSPESFDVGQIFDIEITDNGNVAVAHSTGVYIYNEDANSIYLVSSYPEVSAIEYDEVNDILILLSGGQLVYYSLQSNSVVNSIYLDQGAVDLNIVYNK